MSLTSWWESQLIKIPMLTVTHTLMELFTVERKFYCLIDCRLSRVYKSKAAGDFISHSRLSVRSGIMKWFIVILLSLLPFGYGNLSLFISDNLSKANKWLIHISFLFTHAIKNAFSSAKPPITRSDRMRHYWSQFIIGGSEVQDFSQFAYQLSLRYAEIHICGSSIIALYWALSAGESSR